MDFISPLFGSSDTPPLQGKVVYLRPEDSSVDDSFSGDEKLLQLTCRERKIKESVRH